MIYCGRVIGELDWGQFRVSKVAQSLWHHESQSFWVLSLQNKGHACATTSFHTRLICARLHPYAVTHLRCFFKPLPLREKVYYLWRCETETTTLCMHGSIITLSLAPAPQTGQVDEAVPVVGQHIVRTNILSSLTHSCCDLNLSVLCLTSSSSAMPVVTSRWWDPRHANQSS